jgi:hypothetical protein
MTEEPESARISCNVLLTDESELLTNRCPAKQSSDGWATSGPLLAGFIGAPFRFATPLGSLGSHKILVAESLLQPTDRQALPVALGRTIQQAISQLGANVEELFK